jgi:hypothetical protein
MAERRRLQQGHMLSRFLPPLTKESQSLKRRKTVSNASPSVLGLTHATMVAKPQTDHDPLDPYNAQERTTWGRLVQLVTEGSESTRRYPHRAVHSESGDDETEADDKGRHLGRHNIDCREGKKSGGSVLVPVLAGMSQRYSHAANCVSNHSQLRTPQLSCPVLLPTLPTMHRNPTIDDPIYPAAKVATALFDQYVCTTFNLSSSRATCESSPANSPASTSCSSLRLDYAASLDGHGGDGQ